MRIRLVTDERSLQAVRNGCRLLYDDCCPAEVNFEEGTRYAVVTNPEETLLLVLRHQFPYVDNPVVVGAIVITSPSALSTLTDFLCTFVRHNRGRMRCLRVGTAVRTALHITNGITVADVERAISAAAVRNQPHPHHDASSCK